MRHHSIAVFFISGIINLFVSPVTGCQGSVDLTAAAEPTTLFSTNYPKHYDNLVACSWRIYSTTSASRVYVEVIDADLDNANNNCTDSVAIYDGFNSGGQLLLRVCGQMSSALVKSSISTSMYITFSSDSVRTARGFALRYWSVVEDLNHPRCSPGTVQTVPVTATPQRLDFPDFQVGGSNCDFRLESEAGHVIVLKPDPGTGPEALNCDEEYVTVYDGSSTTGPSVRLWCTETEFTAYRSSGRELYLATKLVSSGRQVSRIGLLVYRESMVSAECSSTVFPQIDVQFSSLYLWIPYTYRSSGQPCPVSAGLRSVAASSDQVITVLGTSLSSVNCSNNYIQVSSYSDTMDYLHKPKCSREGQPYYRVSDPRLVLGLPVGGGGEKYLVEIHAQGYTCDNTTKVYGIEGEDTAKLLLDIPIFSRSYISTSCTFRFKAVDSRHLVNLMFIQSNLEATSDTFCSGNYFRLYDGFNQSSTGLGEYCGQGWRRPPVFTSTSGEIFVELVTQTPGRFVQVELEYSSFKDNRCSGTVELESVERDQFIESPAYPKAVAQNLECMYLITSSDDNPVTVEIQEFSLPADCSDNLKVYNGNSTNAPLLGTWCDSPNTTLQSTTTTVLVVLSTSSHSTDTSFKVRYADNVPRFGSPEDPRVPQAIGAIVGLANGVGLVFLIVYGVCYCRNRSLMKQEDEKTLEEKIEDTREDIKEASKVENEPH